MIPNTVILCSIVLAAVLPYASAISCYQCNSLHDPGCEELEAHLPHVVAGYYQECKGNFTYDPFCRKIDVTVMEGTLRRVVRACGWERSHRPCYKADNDDHLETVCQCFTDGCNGAAGMGAIGAIAATLVAFVTYYL